MAATDAKLADSQDSYVEIFDGGVAMIGKDAIDLFAVINLNRFIKLYLKTGIIPSRGWTGPKMLLLATSYTKKPYVGNGKYERATEDLFIWIETMKAAMPIMENGKQI